MTDLFEFVCNFVLDGGLFYSCNMGISGQPGMSTQGPRATDLRAEGGHIR